MKFTKIRAPDFDLEKTLDSGQVFHWEKVGDGFVGAIGDLPVYVKQRGRRSVERSADSGAGRANQHAGSQELAPQEVSRALFRARSSAGGDLRFVSERSGDERCARFLSRVAHHSAAEMGMSRHIHLFVDETGGAYSPDFAGAPETIRRATEDRRSARVHVRFAAATCTSFGEGITRMQARLSREKSAWDGAARQLRPSGSRGLVGVVRCRAAKTTVRVAGRRAEDC